MRFFFVFPFLFLKLGESFMFLSSDGQNARGEKPFLGLGLELHDLEISVRDRELLRIAAEMNRSFHNKF